MKMLALVLGIIFVVLAILTATGVVSAVPWLGLNGHTHVKHTILYAVLAILSFLWMRFQSNAAPVR
ncbi:MAG: hypothetical protein M3Y21_08925 [Candidatus Eremiobacteraeota bacterium]|nr:hypothetical protein [Candidatus Eremiobacteraeota bacterium]